MFEFLKRKVDHTGSVFFRGTTPPRAEDFGDLRGLGFDLARIPAEDAYWVLRLRHSKLGEARLVALRDMPMPPDMLIAMSNGLTDLEKDELRSAGCSVGLQLSSSRGSVLRDRKTLLKLFHVSLLDTGVGAADHRSEQFYSRAALEDELSAPGEPDVSVLYSIHAITDESGRQFWLHTHGLATVGAFDLDILNPSESLASNCGDFFRALAFAALEGELTPGTTNYPLAQPGGNIRLVPAAQFQARAPAAERALRDDVEGHTERRSVLCNPAGGLSRLMGAPVRASRFLSCVDTERCTIHFSKAATQMMSERARATLSLFERIRDELREFECPALVKIGYPTDSDARCAEHLWFEVHSIRGDAIDATLVSAPHDIRAMRAGTRGTHPVERLTDWVIPSPAGQITPHARRALRMIRERKDELRAAFRTRT